MSYFCTLNSTQQALYESAKRDAAHRVTAKGSIISYTGKRTGRSPHDRFIVEDRLTAREVAWGKVNHPMCSTVFNAIWQKITRYLDTQNTHIGDYHVGWDAKHHLPIQVISDSALHQLFASYLFINPQNYNPRGQKPWQMIHAPNFMLDPQIDGSASEGIVAIDLSERKIVIAGIAYAGEMKKAMFSAMNFILPSRDVLPMHCAAAAYGEHKDQTALFFGLSGTGKTTLSSDTAFDMIGDDEHGWSTDGIFNFEGGCYAKCIHLDPHQEPVIYQAIGQGTILENVKIDVHGQEDFTCSEFTENTRAAYPLSFIPRRVPSGTGAHPEHVIFLTCDLHGVLPAVSMLNHKQAIYAFLSGYTAKVGSTEHGSMQRIQPVFSQCFGAPFFPQHVHVYAELLAKRLAQTNAQVWLVNTGWMGGSGGSRIGIDVSRAIIRGILSCNPATMNTKTLPVFKWEVPTHLGHLRSDILDPTTYWDDQDAYLDALSALGVLFVDNFEQYTDGLCPSILQAGPQLEVKEVLV